MSGGLRISFFGSSLISAYWNGAATYYRGLIRALHERGHRVTFFEPIAFGRQERRDIPDPQWADVVVYPAETEAQVLEAVERARGADVFVKASGVGCFDDLLEAAVLEASGNATAIYWDVDAPATLAELEANPEDPLAALVPQYDLVLTYGGGDAVVERYRAVGARACVPVYNALDPSTHHPAPREPRFACDLAFIGNRLRDREQRVEEFFFRAAEAARDRSFLLGGAGWEDKPLPGNVRYVGHVYTHEHNALNSTAGTVLNVTRDSMAENGYSPPTRVFEAGGAAACVITDAWEGIELFLEPEREVLVARDGEEVAALVDELDPRSAKEIGERARRRLLAEHTYAHRAAQVEEILSAQPALQRA